MNKTQLGAAFVLTAVLATGGVSALASGAPPADPPAVPATDAGDQGSGPDALSSNCKKTFASGAGLTRFVWCFSNDGNIVQLEHSAGLEHVRIGSFLEGFCISSNNVNHGESKGDGGNVGLNPPTYPSPTKVVHTTTDGAWKIEQTFAQTTGTKTAKVTMKVTNTSGVAQSSVFLTRWIDADMSNSTGGDEWVSAGRSVSVSEPGSSRLELLPGNATYTTNTMIFAGALPALNQFCYDPPADGVDIADRLRPVDGHPAATRNGVAGCKQDRHLPVPGHHLIDDEC